jgi:O-antigen ligase
VPVAATFAFLFLAAFAASAGLRVAMLLIAAIALAFHWRESWPELRDHFPRGVLAPLLAWSLLAALSAAWSVDRAYTLSEIRAEVLYGLLAFAVFFLAAGDIARWRTWWFALIGGAAGAIGIHLLQAALPFEISRHAMDGGPGPFSTHLVLVAPVLIAIACPPPWGRERGNAPLAAAFALLAAAAWFTENRIIWAAFAVQLLVGVLAWKAQPSGQGERSRDVVRAVALAALLIALAFGASLAERSEKHFQVVGDVADSIERDPRPQIWSAAWNLFRESPWLGHGFGRETLAASFIPHTPAWLEPLQVRHAHNAFIDIALQLGAVGLAIFLWLLVALAREYRRFLATPVLAPLGIMGLAGFVVKNTTDDFLHRHNALVFWAMNGMLLGFARAARALKT